MAAVRVHDEPIYTVGDKDLHGIPDVVYVQVAYKFDYAGLARVTSFKPTADAQPHTEETVRKFHADILAQLGSTDPDTRMRGCQIVLYLWDTLFRVFQKDRKDVAAHICLKSRSTFNSVTGASLTDDFPPPHADFFLSFEKSFKAGQPAGTHRLLASMMAVKTQQEKAADTSRSVKGWLSATHMLSLEGAGLNLVTWAERASLRLDVPLDKLLKYLARSTTSRSVYRIIQWGRSQLGSTFLWARLIEDTAFASLRIERNKTY